MERNPMLRLRQGDVTAHVRINAINRETDNGELLLSPEGGV